ncbi:MAG: rRNA adenine N-6-methyltransferase family protein [Clostridium sp.]|uniref:class I SAM-dependent methyltransferase n=1 Tax=Clostridium sp. TaxID=1506 RepID=UPI002FC59170
MIKFIKEFIKSPRNIGAVAPSSKYLAEKILREIDFKQCRCIVEYGPGTGIFTEKIAGRKGNNTLFILIEQNLDFYNYLKETYKSNDTIKVINGSAEDIVYYLKSCGIQQADYIVSGLPFKVFDDELTRNILAATKRALSSKGRFIAFQYTNAMIDEFSEFFSITTKKRVLMNIPPAYVLSCQEE